MSQKITINTAHAEIAKDIRLAKQRMFREHSKGAPLGDALQGFLTEVIKSVREQELLLSPIGEAKPEREHETPGADLSKSETADADEGKLDTDAPPAREVGGYRLLSDVERDYVIESIGNDAGGAFHVGAVMLLLEHLVALHLQGKYPLEGEVVSVSERLLAANNDAIETARHALRNETYISLLHLLREMKGGDA